MRQNEHAFCLKKFEHCLLYKNKHIRKILINLHKAAVTVYFLRKHALCLYVLFPHQLYIDHLTSYSDHSMLISSDDTIYIYDIQSGKNIEIVSLWYVF